MVRLVYTCEHGGNFIPDDFATCFENAENDIDSHKGIDFGALTVYHDFVSTNSDFSIYSETCRLLVDLNRSLNSPTLFSEYTQQLPIDVKEKILTDYYYPYHELVKQKVHDFYFLW
ncbi:MAG: hypothetical protein HC906_05540 [Bacteroidales bacterium]|nr:hypothetical protein [Bacteroidales bacterium]